MSEINISVKHFNKWFADKGDSTHILNYNLNSKSVVIDLGGYSGLWAEQILSKYNANLYIIEPIKEFYDKILNKFEFNDKVKVLNVAVGDEDKFGYIYMNDDNTSSNIKDGKRIKVEFNTIQTILNKFQLNEVDLIQINIEGDEYSLLEYILDNNLIYKFKNLQIQFHLGVDNAIKRRSVIRKKLKRNGFVLKYNYPFVWESWNKLN